MKFFAACLLFFASAAFAKPFDVKPGSKVAWTAVGKPGFLKIVGEGGSVTGSGSDEAGTISGDFKVDIAPFKTGMETRDEHMKKPEYLDAAGYKSASLKLKPMKYVDGKETDFEGDLTIKKDTAPVKGKATIKGGVVTAKFTVDMSKYPSIAVPKYLNITVAKEVDVSVDFSY